MEMTRYSLGPLTPRRPGVTVVDVQNRMVDFGVDAFWLSHEPWIVPEPFTPEAGEMWSKEDIDYWIDVLAHVCEEAYTDPEIVQDGAAQPGDPQARLRGRERPGALGDDVARVPPEERGYRSRRGLIASQRSRAPRSETARTGSDRARSARARGRPARGPSAGPP